MIDLSGSTTGWESLFPEDLIPAMLDLMIEAWPQRIRKNDKEDPITLGFCQRMRTLKNFRQTPNVLIVIEESELSVDAEIKGRIDFKFVHGHHENVFFAWEAKRLHITTARPNYAAYTGSEGMGCFISGKYSATQVRGGMLGYVLDDQVPKAWESICKSMHNNTSNLKLNGQPVDLKHPKLDGAAHLAETMHELSDKHMTLTHLLLPAS